MFLKMKKLMMLMANAKFTPSEEVAAGFFSIGVLTVPTVYVTGENSSPTGIPPYLPGHPPVRH